MKLIEPETDEVMNYKGLSLYLKLSAGTLRHKVMNNEIPFFKIGHNVRFSKKKIDAWLEDHHRKTKPKQSGNKAELPAADGGVN
ncbi:MAG: helix-turn-helix domain-containing protein [Treponema sp.]|nr:helix-turn-helix domain-containing protein [Treponema sp.]